MRFVSRPLDQAEGCMLAQTVQAGSQRLRKGVVLTGLMCHWLAAAGYAQVAVAEFGPEDRAENLAAQMLAAALAGEGLVHDAPVNGRCNLRAAADGLFRLDATRLARLNLLDEAVTLATLADRQPVRAGEVVGTVKIIPLAVEGKLLQRAQRIARQGVCRLAAYRARHCALILTRSPLRKDAVLLKTVASMNARIALRGGVMLPPRFCAHEAEPLAAEIAGAQADGADLLLIAGASAVADREDVAPRAVGLAGGQILRFGMPVFPGNLICLGLVGGADLIILPGCAGTDRLNGADWILDRFCSGEQVTPEDIALMGVGGLLDGAEAAPGVLARTKARR
ncbi:hypothetical protein ACELLULO517_17360 [Acidisoma cellulosilytica]|uniref:Molybdopterin molybdenumtransferase n=1 Tax=Acidisoma cellulosilyticum TaxID=2802395 RepID=A0A964E502_9PROT|nr:hypothetical protein [Acidisoma cellulosilyticum]MCB8882016.1 hypothetical protein [Acidisoma cellulosilyticum]